MKLETIHIRNYRALKDVEITNLPSFCVFVGPNGSGKSTMFDVFGFLRDALTNNVRQALQVRGGFKEVVTRDCEDEEIFIELKVRMELLEKIRLVTYSLEIGLDDERKPVVRREVLKYKRGEFGSPFHFLDFQNGEGFAISNEEDFDKPDEDLTREHQILESPDILAIKGLGQFKKFKAASAFRSLVENWRLSDFHITAAQGAKDAGYAEHLSVRGDNLPLVTQYLFETHRDIFDKILSRMADRVPGINDVEAKATEDGRLVLRFRDGAFEDPFVSRFVSDGTIKMFAYLVLLYDPAPFPLLCVEEPENQLYPKLLMELAEEFEAYAHRGGQVFVTTHSPDILNGVQLECIFWLNKINGYTQVFRASDDENLVSLVAEGDLPGFLWKQGILGGKSP